MTRRPRARLTLAAPLACLSAACLAGCADPAPPAPADAPALRVVVTVPPLAGLVRAISPDGTSVRALFPPGVSEHGYEFTPRDVADLRAADIVVYVGLGLEPAVERLLRRDPSPSRRALCFADAAGISAEAPRSGDPHEPHDHASHDHTPHDHAAHEHASREHGADEHEHHDHGAVDPHLWLDPVLVHRLVPALRGAVADALARRGELDDAARADLDRRAADLSARVLALDAEYRRRLADLPSRDLVTDHAAWSRLAERYGLRVAAVIRPVVSGEPTPADMLDAAAVIRDLGVRAVFVEPQFDAAAGRRLAQAAGARLEVLDPLGDEDWFALMERNLLALERGLGGAPPAPPPVSPSAVPP